MLGPRRYSAMLRFLLLGCEPASEVSRRLRSGSMRRLHWWGWIFFLLSSIFYLTIGFRDGDWLMITGSFAFLVGVFFLMAPDRAQNREIESDDHGER